MEFSVVNFNSKEKMSFKSQNLSHLLISCAEKFPKKNSVGWIENNKVNFFNFNEYKNTIESLCLGLFKNEFKPTNRLCILGHTCKEWHFIDFATMSCRGTVVPIYPSYTYEEILYIYNHSESSYLAVQNLELFNKISSKLEQFKNLKMIIFLSEIPENEKEKIPPHISHTSFKLLLSQGSEEVRLRPSAFEEIISQIHDEDIATIVYTSGTTGTPKGAVITQKAFVSLLQNIKSGTQSAFSENDRSLVFLPLSHVLARCDSYLGVLFGWEMIFGRSIERVFQDIQLSAPTVMIGVPRIFEKIYEKILKQINDANFAKRKLFKWALQAANTYYEKIAKDHIPTSYEILQKELAYKLVFSKIYAKFGGKIRYLVSGGAPLAKEIIYFLRNIGLTIVEGYGLTETLGPCFLNPLYKQIPGTVGVALGDTQIKFESDGEILIKTGSLFSEYYKNKDDTNNSIQDGWFYSGDIGELTPEGYLKITDRKKDIIITSGGKNVAPQKIENMMKTQAYISHFIVIGNKRKFLSALVGIEKDNFLNELDSAGLKPDCSISTMSQNTTIRSLVQGSIDIINKELANFETIKVFQILPIELSTDNYLTASLKIKKKELFKQYQNLIEDMYNNSN